MSLLLGDRIEYLKKVMDVKIITFDQYITCIKEYIDHIFKNCTIYFRSCNKTGEYYSFFLDNVFLFDLHHFHDLSNNNVSMGRLNYYCWSLICGSIFKSNIEHEWIEYKYAKFKKNKSDTEFRRLLEEKFMPILGVPTIHNFHVYNHFESILEYDELEFETSIMKTNKLITFEEAIALIKKHSPIKIEHNERRKIRLRPVQD